MMLALTFDGLRVAVAHVGQLSERRMSHLWSAFFEGLAGLGGPPADGAVPELLGLSLRYPGAALAAELKQLAAPATLDIPPLDLGIEDHSTGAPSVRKTIEALDLLEGILAIEVLLARDVLSMAIPRPRLGAGTSAALHAAEQALAAGGHERSPAGVHRAAREQILPAVLEWARGLDDPGPTGTVVSR